MGIWDIGRCPLSENMNGYTFRGTEGGSGVLVRSFCSDAWHWHIWHGPGAFLSRHGWTITNNNGSGQSSRHVFVELMDPKTRNQSWFCPTPSATHRRDALQDPISTHTDHDARSGRIWTANGPLPKSFRNIAHTTTSAHLPRSLAWKVTCTMTQSWPFASISLLERMTHCT